VDDGDDRLAGDQVGFDRLDAGAVLDDDDVAAVLEVVAAVELLEDLAAEAAQAAEDDVAVGVVGLGAVVETLVEQDLAELRQRRGEAEDVEDGKREKDDLRRQAALGIGQGRLGGEHQLEDAEGDLARVFSGGGVFLVGVEEKQDGGRDQEHDQGGEDEVLEAVEKEQGVAVDSVEFLHDRLPSRSIGSARRP
jgi:hypothetical protein